MGGGRECHICGGQKKRSEEKRREGEKVSVLYQRVSGAVYRCLRASALYPLSQGHTLISLKIEALRPSGVVFITSANEWKNACRRELCVPWPQNRVRTHDSKVGLCCWVLG